MKFNELLMNNNFVFLDGGMGTILQGKGLKVGELPEIFAINNPKVIIDIHKDYINAGADIIYANTFGANSFKLAKSGYGVDEVIYNGIKNAREAAYNTDALVALDIGPIGQLLEPMGSLSFEKAYDVFKEQVLAAKDADLIVIETMSDLYEIKAAVLAAKENSDLPVICTMTFEKDLRTFLGCSVSAMALTLEGLGVDAVGINCSLGPKEAYPIVEELSKWTSLPIIVKPNAGMPDPHTGDYDISPMEFAKYMKTLVKLGVKIFGGCCGTRPEFINAVKESLKNESHIDNKSVVKLAACSSRSTLELDIPVLVGKCVNVAQGDDIDDIIDIVMDISGDGAEIICIKTQLDDNKEIIAIIKGIQEMVALPLIVDSNNPNTIEVAVRACNGKPIINISNSNETLLNTVLAIAKKYGAIVSSLAFNGSNEEVDFTKKIIQ